MPDAGSPPHTREARRSHSYSSHLNRITPAYAGSTAFLYCKRISVWDHPRIRGKHVPWKDKNINSEGSPPHTREALTCPVFQIPCLGITPAYAGSTSSRPLLFHCDWDHPRIRGKHMIHYIFCLPLIGSPPHTREALREMDQEECMLRITPAYAGSTFLKGIPSLITQDHPRIRGKHFLPPFSYLFSSGSPPHTREAHRNSHPSGMLLGITPAYAGSTLFPLAIVCRTKDHPRIRGKH